jgi:sporulation protein YlmC with PRC-barrel domain
MSFHLSRLIGAEVIDARGASLGHVHDVRLVQDGPGIGAFGAALRLHSLVFGSPSFGARLGFDRRDVKGPWPLKALFVALHKKVSVAEWTQLASIEPHLIRLRVPSEELSPDVAPPRAGGRIVDAGLELLDRQMIDPDGRMAGNVDDLELRFPDQPHGPPVVTAILAGPGALAERLGGRLGRWVGSVHARLRDEDLDGPARIDFGIVSKVGSDVRLTVSRDDLGTMRFERWVRDRVIERIPGN